VRTWVMGIVGISSDIGDYDGMPVSVEGGESSAGCRGLSLSRRDVHLLPLPPIRRVYTSCRISVHSMVLSFSQYSPNQLAHFSSITPHICLSASSGWVVDSHVPTQTCPSARAPLFLIP
jgi:hypothetical protein